MDFGAVLAADKQPAETQTALHDSMSIFPVDNVRATVHSEVDFDKLKQIKQHGCPAGTTINDVILTAFTGAIRRYLEKQNDPCVAEGAAEPLMRSFCAFSMPDLPGRIAGPSSLYNEFVMPSIALNLTPDREARLQATHDAMAEVKVSFVGYFTLVMTSVLAQLGLEEFAGATNREIFKNHSFVYSNVPGFESQVYAFGQKMTGIQTYYNNMISQCIFLSCMGELTMSLMTDKAMVKEPQFLADAFVSEINEWHAALPKRK